MQQTVPQLATDQ